MAPSSYRNQLTQRQQRANTNTPMVSLSNYRQVSADSYASSSSSGEANCCNLLGINQRKLTAASSAATTDDDAILAKELNDLSFKEREQVYDDIHGVSAGLADKETPEFIAKAIERLNAEIGQLPRTKRPTLDKAIFLKPSIETDMKFKLMFLRADEYDAFKAARRLAKYFEDKQSLFGEDKLVKKITLDDLNEEDMQLFRKGPCMVLPQKDSAGRPVWLSNITRFDFSKPKSLVSSETQQHFPSPDIIELGFCSGILVSKQCYAIQALTSSKFHFLSTCNLFIIHDPCVNVFVL